MRVLCKDVIRATALVAGVTYDEVCEDRRLAPLRKVVVHLCVHRYDHYVTRVALTIGIDRARVNRMLKEPLVTDVSALELAIKIIHEVELNAHTHKQRCFEALARRSEAPV